MDLKSFFKKDDAGRGGFLTWSSLRDFAILTLCSALAYRLAVSEVSIDLSGFGFTDLLSLILAISAIVLSAAFYFKADESSKSFYNNSYEFTKNISELLGRIEERFGAQLLSIHKSQDSFDKRIGEFQLDVSKVKEGEDKANEVIEKSRSDSKRIIDNLMQKAQLNAEEMEDMRAELATLKSNEERAKKELDRNASPTENQVTSPLAISDTLYFTLRGLARKYFNLNNTSNLGVMVARFNELCMLGVVDVSVIREMEEYSLIKDGILTSQGASLLKGFVHA